MFVRRRFALALLGGYIPENLTQEDKESLEEFEDELIAGEDIEFGWVRDIDNDPALDEHRLCEVSQQEHNDCVYIIRCAE